MPWDTTAKRPRVVLLDETWLPLEGRQQPVAVVLNTAGQPCDLRRPGPDSDWTCWAAAATLWRDMQAVAPGLAPDPQAKRPSWVEVGAT